MGGSCGIPKKHDENAVVHPHLQDKQNMINAWRSGKASGDEGNGSFNQNPVENGEHRRSFVSLASAYLMDTVWGPEVPTRILKVKPSTNHEGWSGNWLIPCMLFGHASEDYCMKVAARLKPRMLNNGETLFREGDEGTSMFFINKGRVSVQIKEKQIAELGPAMYLGELVNEGRTATIIALDECELLELQRTDFYEVIADFPEFANNIYKALSDMSKKRIQEQSTMLEAPARGLSRQSSNSSSSGGLSRTSSSAQTKRSLGESAVHLTLMKGVRSAFSRSFESATSPTPFASSAMEFLQAASLGAEKEQEVAAQKLKDKVHQEISRPGLIVSLSLDEYLASANPPCRFPGDEGPGQLMEDHFGDGTMWRVRWLKTNCWGIYSTGFEGQYHLYIGASYAKEAWDDSAFLQPGRMPSFFFCAPVPNTAAERTAMLNYSSPRSRLLMQP